MEPRILNFVEAMNLAKLLQKYELPIEPTSTMLNVINQLVQSISPEDFIALSSIVGIDIYKNTGTEVINLVAESFNANKVINLLDFYKRSAI